MKKRILVLTMSLIMMLSIAACGSKPAAGKGSALADWYNSEARVTLENTSNAVSESLGMTFEISIEEPDTIIYTYKYTEQLDFSGLSQEDIDAIFAQSLDSGATIIVSDIGQYRSTYGMPLTTIRMVYINYDGSLIYSQDITEDYESPAASDQASEPASGYDSIQAWLESEEAAATVEVVNNMISSSGMTMKMSADGNVLVYEYYVSDELGLSEVAEEDIVAASASTVESQRAIVANVFDVFETQYGIKLEAVRYSYYTEDGSKLLYSADIANE